MARKAAFDDGRDFWQELGEHFGLAALKPKLADDVRLRRGDDEVELVHLPTRRAIPLGEQGVRLVRQFDGKRTIGEMIVGEIGEEHTLAIEPVLRLVERVSEAGMLAEFPPSVFRQLETHISTQAIGSAHRKLRRDETGHVESEEAVSSFEQMPWRPRTPILEERAKFLRTVDLFRDIDLRTLGALAEIAHEEALPAATNIITEGQVADRFYIIKSGEANVVKTDADGKQVRIAHLETGDHFGETGLLENATRSASVRASPSRPIIVLSFEAETFERIISPQVDAFRSRQDIADRRDRLAKIPIFSALSGDDLERVAEVIGEQEVRRGETVFKQGDEGDRFYVVVSGAVQIVKGEVIVADLGPGSFFGETALLFTNKRTATVIADSNATLWTLDKPAFQKLVREQLLGRRDLMPTLLNRLHR